MSIPAPSRVLVVMPRWVGDAVMATPLIDAVHEQWPEASIDLLMKRYLRGLFNDEPWLNDTLEIGGESSFRSLRADIARRRYDLAFLLPNSFRPAILTALGRVRRRVGYRRNGRAPLLTHGLPFPTTRPFRMVEFYGALGARVGIDGTDRPMRLHVSDDRRKAAAALLAHHGVSSDRTIVAINPGAKYGSSKLWPTRHFAAAADQVAETTDANIILLAGPGEDELAEEIRAQMAASATHLPAAEVDLSMLAAVLTHTDLLLTNDTGPRHMGRAVGVPTVTVYGPTHATWGESDHHAGVDCLIPVECGPCMERTCPLGHHQCMTELPPDRVAEAAIELLAQCGGSDGSNPITLSVR